jgi:3-isopropylmalate dehydrogenase
VLATSTLWREIANEVAVEYSDVHLEHTLVDNCAVGLMSEPRRFDVIVAENLFGYILQDVAGVLTGSHGKLEVKPMPINRTSATTNRLAPNRR